MALATSPALAQGPLEAQQAAALTAQGVALFHDQKYDEAAEAYRKAYALEPTTDRLLKLGICEYNAQHWLEAVAHFRALGASEGLPDSMKAVAKQWLAAGQTKVARVDVHVPAGAELLIDGAPPATAPVIAADPAHPRGAIVSVDVLPGNHELGARWGAAEQTRYVGVAPDAKYDVQFAPFIDVELAPDGASSPGAKPAPSPAERPPAPDDRAPRRSPRMPVALALAGAAAVSAGIATVFYVNYAQATSEVNRLSGALGPSGCVAMPAPLDCGQLHHDRDMQRSNVALGDGFAIGAGAAALSAVGVLAFWPSDSGLPHSGRITVRPLAGAGQAGALVAGAW